MLHTQSHALELLIHVVLSQAAEAEVQKAANAPIPGKGFCETSCRVCPQCKLALAEQAERDAQAKKEQEKVDRQNAKNKAEEEKVCGCVCACVRASVRV